LVNIKFKKNISLIPITSSIKYLILFLNNCTKAINNKEFVYYYKSGLLKKDFNKYLTKSIFFKPYKLLKTYQIYDLIKRKGLQAYKLKELNAGLRSVNNINDDYIKNEYIYRIIDAYLKAKKNQKRQPIQYQITGMWKYILHDSQRYLKTAFKERNIEKIKNILKNFAINQVSKGLYLFNFIPTNFISKIETLNIFNLKYFYWKKLTNLGEFPTGYIKEIGNLPGIKKNERIFPFNSFRFSYYANKICELLSPKKKSTLLEIGGGYCGLYYHLLYEHDINITYLNFDIPEICVLASFFLMNNFPLKKILLFGEEDLKNVDIKDYDIIIIPNYEIKKVVENSCDLVFNSHSLIDMEYLSIKEYLFQINRIAPKYFLHINHNIGKFYKPPDIKDMRAIDLNIPEFELPIDNYRRLYRDSEWISGVGRYPSFEYLYKRID